ncbi:MAG TPA: hypothetical protein VF604_12960 [Pyrinomonadaceae bacterium]|jgi:hypothetical protein
MNLKILFLLAFLVLPAAAPAQKKEFVGYRHRGVVSGETLSNGARDLGGGLLSNEDYGVSRFSKGKKQMLWLEKITSRDKKGIPSWEVLDVLVINNPKKNQQFLFSYSSTCTQNDEENLDLIVLAELQPVQKIYKILEAWQADLLKEKFEKVSVEGIKCDYVEP